MFRTWKEYAMRRNLKYRVITGCTAVALGSLVMIGDLALCTDKVCAAVRYSAEDTINSYGITQKSTDNYSGQDSECKAVLNDISKRIDTIKGAIRATGSNFDKSLIISKLKVIDSKVAMLAAEQNLKSAQLDGYQDAVAVIEERVESDNLDSKPNSLQATLNVLKRDVKRIQAENKQLAIDIRKVRSQLQELQDIATNSNSGTEVISMIKELLDSVENLDVTIDGQNNGAKHLEDSILDLQDVLEEKAFEFREMRDNYAV